MQSFELKIKASFFIAKMKINWNDLSFSIHFAYAFLRDALRWGQRSTKRRRPSRALRVSCLGPNEPCHRHHQCISCWWRLLEPIYKNKNSWLSIMQNHFDLIYLECSLRSWLRSTFEGSLGSRLPLDDCQAPRSSSHRSCTWPTRPLPWRNMDNTSLRRPSPCCCEWVRRLV